MSESGSYAAPPHRGGQDDDAPRGRWTSQELVFDGGEWVFWLYLTDTDRESEIVGAIVARLSAQTGVINSVELVQGARPPGS